MCTLSAPWRCPATDPRLNQVPLKQGVCVCFLNVWEDEAIRLLGSRMDTARSHGFAMHRFQNMAGIFEG